MRLRTAAALAIPFLLVLAVVAADAPEPSAPPPPDPTKAEGHYKNIQALKGFPADDVVPAMQFMSAALGVDCEFCHVENEPEKDDNKHKTIARKMIAMTLAINRDNFDGELEVTCMSCHQGTTHPVGVPVVATGERKVEPVAPKAADLPTLSAVLDKYTQAAGGSEALAKITTRIQKGKLVGFGPDPLPVEVFTKAPDKRATIVHHPKGENITAFDGQRGWLSNTGRPPRDMSPLESEAARLDATVIFPSDFTRLFNELKVASLETIDGKQAVKLVGKPEGNPPVALWFDTQSGLIVRLVRSMATPVGRNPTQIDYADFRAADGVTIPFRWTVSRPSGSFTIQIDESQQNAAVDDKAFEKPSSAPPS